MAYETSRRAQREALPWLMLGFSALVVAVGLLAVSNVGRLEVLARGFLFVGVSHVLGALGSGSLLMGLLYLARARVGGYYSPWFLGAFFLWLGELVLRLWTLILPEVTVVPALRLFLANWAMFCLATGMLRMWRGAIPRARLRSWFMARRLFVLQFLAYLSLPVAAAAAGATLSEAFVELTNAVPLGLALAWLIFAGPFAALMIALRRTVSWISEGETVAEILGG